MVSVITQPLGRMMSDQICITSSNGRPCVRNVAEQAKIGTQSSRCEILTSNNYAMQRDSTGCAQPRANRVHGRGPHCTMNLTQRYDPEPRTCNQTECAYTNLSFFLDLDFPDHRPQLTCPRSCLMKVQKARRLLRSNSSNYRLLTEMLSDQ